MKPESIQYLFDCYLREKNDSSPQYDYVDGVSYARRMAPLRSESLAGEPGGIQDDRCSELDLYLPEASLPNVAQCAHLDPEQEEIARSLGRQLSNLSDDYDAERSGFRNQSLSGENEKFQFQKPCLFVSRNEDKIKIKIARRGNSDGTSNIAWKTKDRTAFAGVHYVEASGTALFKGGEVNAVIEVKLLGNHRDKDVSFLVELLDSDGIEIGSINPVTVYITDHENLYDDERQVVDNIVESRSFSLDNIKACLMDKVTVNTFKTALMYACSNADSVPREFAYAFELLRFAMPAARRESLMRVVCNYFQSAPELKEMQQYLQDCEENSEDSDDMEEDSDED